MSKPITPIALRWNLSKFVVLKHSGREILLYEPFVAFFSTIYMLKSLFVKIFQQNMSLSQRNLRGLSIDVKLNNLDLMTQRNSKHYRRDHVHIDIHCFMYSRWNLSKFVVLKHFGWEFLHGEPCCYLDVSIYMLKCVFCPRPTAGGVIKLVAIDALYRGETRALIGGVNIHIFVFCPTNFFWN